jgi:hypothetical protein
MIMNKLSNEIRELTDANAALSDEELELSVGGQQKADGPTAATKGKTAAFFGSLVGNDAGAGANADKQAA